jgi:hypothetical protein
MPDYLAITQATAEWILSKPALLDALHALLQQHDDKLLTLVAAELVEGPIRLSTSSDGIVTAIWNIDYLSGTGEEPWGFLALRAPYGLRSEPAIGREVLERSLYVINQRLQGLFIDGAMIHRAHSNGAHTCIAGRGTAARQSSIAYVELKSEEALGQHALICVGPEHDFDALTAVAVESAKKLESFVATAQRQISPARKRVVADPLLLPDFRRAIAPFALSVPGENEFREVEVATAASNIDSKNALRAFGLTYRHWVEDEGPLSDIQRRILFSNAIERHPLRIVGPGGSGKTLLMQLLALRRLSLAADQNTPLRVLYIVHNAAMAHMVKNRFEVLCGEDAFVDNERILDIITLADYGRTQLNLDYSAVIDPDAYEAKQFQLEQITDALRHAMDALPAQTSASRLFSEVRSNDELVAVVARLIMAEVSTAIKGHGLEADKKRYVFSERRLSRFHAILSQAEREIVYAAYERYHHVVFEQYEVLDTDDIALSLLGRLRTPIWELKRRKLGYDYVFVDETQLFNENERRVLPLLTNGASEHVPIVLALDEAQDIYGQSTAGMATLGIPDIANENLATIHRSTRAIVRLAFFVIQRSTDLFGPDFPDFTGIAEHMAADSHALAAAPAFEVAGDTRFGRFVVKRIRDLRRANLRRIAVICHADQYWDAVHEELKASDLPLHVLLQRGERIPAEHPVVVLSRPAFVGGQEFDAVVLVGLEQGVVPPRVPDNDALAAAVEQQSLREIYLAVTRARYRLIVAIAAGAAPTSVLQEAARAGFVVGRLPQLDLFAPKQ